MTIIKWPTKLVFSWPIMLLQCCNLVPVQAAATYTYCPEWRRKPWPPPPLIFLLSYPFIKSLHTFNHFPCHISFFSPLLRFLLAHIKSDGHAHVWPEQWLVYGVCVHVCTCLSVVGWTILFDLSNIVRTLSVHVLTVKERCVFKSFTGRFEVTVVATANTGG